MTAAATVDAGAVDDEALEAIALIGIHRRRPDHLPKVLGEDLPLKLIDRLIRHPKACRDLYGRAAASLPGREWRRMAPRRPERMIAIARTALALGWRCDLVSARCGTPRRDSYTTATGEQVRHMNGIGQLWEDAHGEAHGFAVEAGLSLWELRRALADMILAGWVIKSQRCEKYQRQDGTWGYCAWRAVYVLTAKFWEAMQLAKPWRKARAWASRQAGHRPRIYAGPLLRAPVRRAAADIDAAENEARRVAALELKLLQRYPNWARDRIRSEARRLARE